MENKTMTQMFSTGYYALNDYLNDIQRLQSDKMLITGFDKLDNLQTFYPGLYTVGAIPSLGKTTFCHQIADRFAAQKHPVLYFSLEQSRCELLTKSFVRGFFRTNNKLHQLYGNDVKYPSPTSLDIRFGHNDSYFLNELKEQINVYFESIGSNLLIIHGTTPPTVEEIVDQVEKYISQENVKPVVIVDYLQIIRPSSINGRSLDSKASVDHVVAILKSLQVKYDLIVMLISSLNRQNYMTPIDFESFKESGGIEYSSDVLWGLQLSVLSDPNFDREKSIAVKRQRVAQAKLENPRNIELVCLKNRNGISGYVVPFKYYTDYDSYYCA